MALLYSVILAVAVFAPVITAQEVKRSSRIRFPGNFNPQRNVQGPQVVGAESQVVPLIVNAGGNGLPNGPHFVIAKQEGAPDSPFGFVNDRGYAEGVLVPQEHYQPPGQHEFHQTVPPPSQHAFLPQGFPTRRQQGQQGQQETASSDHRQEQAPHQFTDHQAQPQHHNEEHRYAPPQRLTYDQLKQKYPHLNPKHQIFVTGMIPSTDSLKNPDVAMYRYSIITNHGKKKFLDNSDEFEMEISHGIASEPSPFPLKPKANPKPRPPQISSNPSLFSQKANLPKPNRNKEPNRFLQSFSSKQDFPDFPKKLSSSPSGIPNVYFGKKKKTEKPIKDRPSGPITFDSYNDRPGPVTFDKPKNNRPGPVTFDSPSFDKPGKGRPTSSPFEKPNKDRFTGPSFDKPTKDRYNTGPVSFDKPNKDRFTGPSFDKSNKDRFPGPTYDKPNKDRFTGPPAFDKPNKERFPGQSFEKPSNERFPSPPSFGKQDFPSFEDFPEFPPFPKLKNKNRYPLPSREPDFERGEAKPSFKPFREPIRTENKRKKTPPNFPPTIEMLKSIELSVDHFSGESNAPDYEYPQDPYRSQQSTGQQNFGQQFSNKPKKVLKPQSEEDSKFSFDFPSPSRKPLTDGPNVDFSFDFPSPKPQKKEHKQHYRTEYSYDYDSSRGQGDSSLERDRSEEGNSGSDWIPINAPEGAAPARSYDIPAPDLSRGASFEERDAYERDWQAEDKDEEDNKRFRSSETVYGVHKRGITQRAPGQSGEEVVSASFRVNQ